MKISELIEQLEEYDSDLEVNTFNLENGKPELIKNLQLIDNSVLIVSEPWFPF